MRPSDDHAHLGPARPPEIVIHWVPAQIWVVARARAARIADAVRSAHISGVPF